MRKKAILVLSAFFLGCTTVARNNEVYSTFGQARIEECNQIVYPEGMGEGKEAIGFGCKRFESDGLSAEFTAAFGLLLGWIPWPF